MQETSLSRYMHFSQRETSADVVNASILVAGSTEKRPVKSQDSSSSLPQVQIPPLLVYHILLLDWCLRLLFMCSPACFHDPISFHLYETVFPFHGRQGRLLLLITWLLSYVLSSLHGQPCLTGL